jgi:parallel beta-helix repeat protein
MGMGKPLVVLFLLILAFSLVVLPLPVHAESRNITVPTDYASIQEAINKADPGDTIYVKAGDYNGSLIIQKSIALIGQKGTRINNWIIGVQPAILVTANNVTIKGLTIDNPSISPPWQVKRGIHLLGATNCLIQNNTVRRCDEEGIWLYQSVNNTIDGNTVNYATPALSIGDSANNIITNNYLTSKWTALSLYNDAYNNTFTDNTIFDSDEGVLIGDLSYDNLFYHNNFLSNRVSVAGGSANQNGTNAFDNGSEGNYYSDYNDIDADGDGIGDSPYAMIMWGRDLIDNYPLMQQWTDKGLPPVIRILSPAENATISTDEVTLSFWLSRATSEIKYSLDGAATVTLNENLTLTKLGNGNHTLTIYSIGTSGNEAQPRTVHFFISKPTLQPDSIALIAGIPILVVVIVGVVLLLLQKKRAKPPNLLFYKKRYLHITPTNP